jgi:hypothetical protein
MVHALEITHGMLKRGGILIDIHPSGHPPSAEVHAGGKTLLAGHLDEESGFFDYYAADNALADVTARGLFELEREGLFPFMIHAPSITAMDNYLETEWSDAIVPEKVLTRLANLMSKPGEGKEIVVREIVRISRYRSSSRQFPRSQIG